MTEEAKNDNEGSEHQYTDIEKRAMEMGWNPDFDGPEEDFIDAKEFVRRKPLFDKIEHQSKELKQVSKALEALKNHYSVAKETEYKRALNDLKSARKQAITDGDGNAFELLDAQIKDAEREVQEIKEIKEKPLVQEEVPSQQEFVDWKTKNRWYQSDEDMTTYADALGIKLAKQGKPPSDVLAEVEKAVKRAFPHKFTNPNKQNAPDVDTSRGANKSSKETFELNETERKIMNDLVRSGIMTKEQYIADLKEAHKVGTRR